MGYHHIGQAGLELPTSGDLPTSASQSSGITGVSHRTRSSCVFPVILSQFLCLLHMHVAAEDLRETLPIAVQLSPLQYSAL